MPDKRIYIVVSHTGSIVGKMIGIVTHTPYNHVSVSVDGSLEHMFSFGRRFAYFPWLGGFVEEGPHFGTLKRFPGTEVIVISMRVDEERFSRIEQTLVTMHQHKNTYHYNALGLIFAGLGRAYKRDRHFYCSEFVKDLLIRFDLAAPQCLPELVRPTDFLKLPNASVIYRGRLLDFSDRWDVQV